jgi:hypothetical protein
MTKPSQPLEAAQSSWTSDDSSFTMNGVITAPGKSPVRQFSSRPSAIATLALGAMLPFAAMGQSAPAPSAGVQVDGYCDPQVLTVLVEQYKAQQNDIDTTLNPLYKSIKDVAEDSWSSMSSCVDMSWPNISFQRPTMDQIIKGVAQMAVRKVCSEARQAIGQLNSAVSNSYYMNTRIPGVPSFGMSTSNYGPSGVTINGTPAPGGLYVPPTPPPTP